MDLGATLRRARENRGLSVESLARITKIRADHLRAIEATAFDRVPTGIFLRGFLRSYAREVGLDPDAIVQQFHDEFDPPTPPPPEPVRKVSPVLEWWKHIRSLAEGFSWHVPSGAQWIAVALLAAAVIGYTAARAPVADGRRPGVTPPPRQPVGTPLPVSAAEALPRDIVGTGGDGLQIDITSKAPCWVAATSDGQRVVYELLEPGAHRIVQAHDALVLRVGDPAAFVYRINGAPGRPVGRRAEPVTVTITRENYRSYVDVNTRTGG
jgi:cytoskeletal protein RodZ